MMTTETAPHFDKITRALGDKVGNEVSEQELREQFEKFMEYGVPPDQAVRSILRQYGDTPGQQATDPNAGPVKLVDLAPNLSFVNLLVRVVHVQEREITVRGEPKTIWTGIFGDDTGTRPFTSWSEFGFDKGAVIRIKGAYTKEFNSETQINLGDRCEVQEGDATDLPEYEPSVSEKPIAELAPGIGNVIVTGRVMSLEKRQVLARGEQKTITTGLLADQTGKIAFTAWADLDLQENQVVRVDPGYIKAYRGVPQFNFDDAATIETLADDAVPAADDLAVTEPMTIGDLIAKGGANGVTVRATLLEVRPPSGLVFRDPDTNRVLRAEDRGGVDGPQGNPDLRVKCILDDGTGAINAVVNRAGTEKLLGRTLDEAMKMAEELMSWDVIEEQLKAKLTARTFEVTGNALSDDFGMMLIVERITPLKVDVPERAKALAETVKAATGGA